MWNHPKRGRFESNPLNPATRKPFFGQFCGQSGPSLVVHPTPLAMSLIIWALTTGDSQEKINIQAQTLQKDKDAFIISNLLPATCI